MVCTLCFTLTTIAGTYNELAYSFWKAAGYNTMVAFHAIVGGNPLLCFHFYPLMLLAAGGVGLLVAMYSSY